MNTASQVDAQNKATSAAEVERFKANPPDKYFVYVRKTDGRHFEATTWMGDILGRGILGDPYKCPAFGTHSTRQSVLFDGINGYQYVGTYFTSSGNYARVRMTAQSKRRLTAESFSLDTVI